MRASDLSSDVMLALITLKEAKGVLCGLFVFEARVAFRAVVLGQGETLALIPKMMYLLRLNSHSHLGMKGEPKIRASNYKSSNSN